MPIMTIYRLGGQEELEARHLLNKLNFHPILRGLIKSIDIESCFYLDMKKKFATPVSLNDYDRDLERIKALINDPWITENNGLRLSSSFKAPTPPKYFMEIGPKLNFKSAFSTNCVSICKSLGINYITRIEQGKLYLFTGTKLVLQREQLEVILKIIFDPMTQDNYSHTMQQLWPNPDKLPQTSWYTVLVLEKGRKALKEENVAMNLGFDRWDINYYYNLFTEVLKRNPTNVELFDLAQSNSEHSRHWFFKGTYIIADEVYNKSLLEMVMETNPDNDCPLEGLTHPNSIIKFSDNSSCIRGYELLVFFRSEVMFCGQYVMALKKKHIVFTAETHNFPTALAPFSGATTGTGGRIRDVQAVGRGGWVIAGTVGYCVGNLRIPGYIQDWEDDAVYSRNMANPLDILIGASDGASDYGNKFGEPVICGFTRSFGQRCGLKNERREWIKPIMFSGGIGTLDAEFVHKKKPQIGDFVVKIGGPAYRIGVGGGAASSSQVQGGRNKPAERKANSNAVQRGDPEMEQKLNRVIRGCIELQYENNSLPNPINSIHDQGAGGNANVLKEIVEGIGAVIFTKEFSTGDSTLTTMELWGAEYQESNAVIVNKSNYKYIKQIAEREKCPIDIVGYITGDETITLVEGEMDKNIKINQKQHPVHLKLPEVLKNIPRRQYILKPNDFFPLPIEIKEELTIEDVLRKVLRLPSVGSKRFLTSKVDRSVSGLIVQQQCVGPLQLPLADVAVVALDYFSHHGAATSIGEQPFKMLVNPRAGAKMAVIEALTNMCSAKIEDLEKVKCSANWMYAAKLDGEGLAMYQACEAMCEIMRELKIGVDGGKDSLSMAASVTERGQNTVIKAPGSLVISAYAPVPDINKIVTPDLKSGVMRKHLELFPKNSSNYPKKTSSVLYLVKPAYCSSRIGGSALAQVFNSTGEQNEVPDLTSTQVGQFVNAFNAIQKLINNNRILALHDISDGGLITCLLEMAIGGYTGINIDLPANFIKEECTSNVGPHLLAAFNEEPGWVLEVYKEDVNEVEQLFQEYNLKSEAEYTLLGKVDDMAPKGKIFMKYKSIPILHLDIKDALTMWDETSFQIEIIQMNRELAESERCSMKPRIYTSLETNFKYNPNFIKPSHLHLKNVQPKVAIIREEGCNGDRELAAAFSSVGFQVYDVTIWDLQNHPTLDICMFNGIAFPGGFSYADVLGSGTGWAAIMTNWDPLLRALRRWNKQPHTFSLGICNGCQLMAKMGWVNISIGPYFHQGVPQDNFDDFNVQSWTVENMEYGPDCKVIPDVRLIKNDSGRFECRWVHVRVGPSRALLLAGMEANILAVWAAHGEGKFEFRSSNTTFTYLTKNCVPLQYVGDEGHSTETYPLNPNGSEGGIAAVCSLDGRHLAMMPHPERSLFGFQCPYSYSKQGLTPWAKMFQNAYDMVTSQGSFAVVQSNNPQ